MKMRNLAGIFAGVVAVAAVAGGLASCDRDDGSLATTTTTTTDPEVSTPAPGAATKPAPKPRIAEERIKPDPSPPFKPDQFLGQVIQTVRGFNRPHSTTIGLDGKSFYVTNSAATTEGYPYKKG